MTAPIDPTRPLTIYTLWDGTRGHEKQTRAVLDALAELRPVRVHDWHLRGPSGRARLGDIMRYARRQRPDLALGTGRRTHLPLLAVKLAGGARAATCMRPESWVAPFMDLCCVPEHDRRGRPANVLVTHGPPCPAVDRSRHDPQRSLILVGGLDERRHQWDAERLMIQVRDVLANGGPETFWTIGSSPRTPASTVTRLAQLAGRRARVAFYPAEATPPGWIETAYAAHATVWVTADSVSMVYEALSAGCRVGLLPVNWRRGGAKFRRSETALVTRGWVVRLDDYLAGRAAPQALPDLNEARRCAAEMVRRWWPDR